MASLFVEAVFFRVVEDLISTKIRRLQGGNPSAADHRILTRVHRAALARLDHLRRALPSDATGAGADLGLNDARVEVVASNPAWPTMFHDESGALLCALGGRARGIYHIGSTSIPGLPAKPIIDIAVTMDAQDLAADLTGCINAMAAAGYAYQGDWGHRGGYFFAKDRGRVRTHAVQLHSANSPDLARLLRFQAMLRTSPEQLQEYTEIKIALARRFPTQRGMYFWFKAHWINDRLLPSDGTEPWGAWFVAAQNPTLLQIFARTVVLTLRGRGLHPMAVK